MARSATRCPERWVGGVRVCRLGTGFVTTCYFGLAPLVAVAKMENVLGPRWARPRSRREREVRRAALRLHPVHSPGSGRRSRAPAYHTRLGPGRSPVAAAPLAAGRPPWSEAWRGTTNATSIPAQHCESAPTKAHRCGTVQTGPLRRADSRWVISGSTSSRCTVAS